MRGIDTGFDPADAGTPTDEPAFDTNQTVREQFVEQLTAIGFSTEEANCVVDEVDFNATNITDAELLEVFSRCGISPDRLEQIGF